MELMRLPMMAAVMRTVQKMQQIKIIFFVCRREQAKTRKDK
jgi:hypothetical protein